METFKCDAITSDRDGRNPAGWHPMLLEDPTLRQDEIEKAFRAISLHFFIKPVVARIGTHIPNGRRVQVFEDVFAETPSLEADSTVSNPRGKPKTPFSEPRDASKSNAQLIDCLALAADLDAKKAFAIRGQIAWGGRLGRDHTLADVPKHYVRDRLLDYINTQLPEDQRDAVRRAVFPEFSPSELAEYSALVAGEGEDQDKDEDDKEADSRPRKTQSRPNKTQSRLDVLGPEHKKLAARVLGNRAVKSMQELEGVLQQGMALDEIDQDIDLGPRPHSGIRDYDYPEPIYRSGQTSIDRDCDQIRAMIARFTRCGSEWAVDKFRLALDGISHAQLMGFLQRRGSSEGSKMTVYQLPWEFFKKRELLGLPLEGSVGSPALKERDGNRGKKRASGGGEGGKGTGKRTKIT
ncbi:Uu.00g110460.m01.CDS01 [Anthostomella pinea]|uniref:Uu.00g110460.m01.CDS01 n=1 Tax=Anthostomella pinea TaxID=933095 RepID=A0AAI8VEU0_9PEZI|nr:Uu.00g110460.m01.CDS01 [Anthostomella pinea]